MTGAPNKIRVDHTAGGFRLRIDIAWTARTVALFGPSGAGKSTLLEIAAGIRRARRVHVRLAGRLLEDAESRTRVAIHLRRIGWVPQEGTLFPHLTVAQNVSFGAGRACDRARLASAVDMLEIGGIMDRRPAELSGGERQRVALARALAAAPAILLLDEPLASLDLPLRSRILPYLLRLRDTARLPMIYVTHDASEALGIAEHVIVLDGGRIVASGSPDALLGSPAALRVLDLVGMENRFVVRAVDALPAEGLVRITTTRGLSLRAGDRFECAPGSTIGVRAEDIIVAIAQPNGISAQNILEARLRGIAEASGRILLSIECAEERVTAAITPHAASDLRLEAGQRVWIVLKASSIHALPGPVS